MKALFIVIVASASAFFVAGSKAALQPEMPQPAPNSIVLPAANPHWRPDGCTACHAVEQENMKTVPSDQVDLICLTCHDGVRARREPHPIGRSFAGEQVRRPEFWPTPGGLLSCITCHDVLQGCNPAARRPAVNSAMLRVKRADAPTVCNECHIAERHQQYKPHAMLRDTAAATTQSCMFCHKQEMPAGSKAARSGDSLLKTDEITLCGQCHKQHVDFFTPGHIGATVTPPILENMLKTDERLRLSHGRTDPFALPLSDGKLVCSTCHNPHQAGVFLESNVLGLGAMSLDPAQSGGFALRVKGGQLCLSCHGSISPRSR